MKSPTMESILRLVAVLAILLSAAIPQLQADTVARTAESVELCTAETHATGECSGIVPSLEDVRALQAEIARLQQENTKLRSSLSQSTPQTNAVAVPSGDVASSRYPFPPGTCVHPPHFRFRDARGRTKVPLNRSDSRMLTDPHGLTLNLEPVRRGEPFLRGDAGEFGVAELTKIPGPMEFIRDYVSLSRPFVVRNATSNWTAYKLWTDSYLATKLGRISLHVRRDKHRDRVFHYNREATMIQMSFRELVEAMQTPEEREQYLAEAEKKVSAAPEGSRVRRSSDLPELEPDRLYLAQAPIMWGKKPSTLKTLCDDLDGMCPQPTFTYGLSPKHMNLWYGRGNKTVILHYDNNEGVMAMMSGYKNFTLYGPSQRNYLYPMNSNERSAVSSLIPDAQLSGSEPLDTESFPCFKHAQPTIVTIGPGDLFYLPAYYWHRVHSYGRSLGVNWWFSAHSLMLQQFMKTIDLNVDITEGNGTVRPQSRW